MQYPQADINALVDEYYDKYDILLRGQRSTQEFSKHVAVQAQIEIGFERFLEEKNYQAIVTHFGDLGALKQLPGLAIQRLMEKGYGFGAEGDWKTGSHGASDEDHDSGNEGCQGYFHAGGLHLQSRTRQRRAFCRRICWRSARPSRTVRSAIKCQPLSMGDREDPARLVFTSKDRTRYRYIPDRSGQPFPSHHQRCGLQEDRKADAEASGSNAISGHRSRICTPARKHGSSQAAHITPHLPTT